MAFLPVRVVWPATNQRKVLEGMSMSVNKSHVIYQLKSRKGKFAQIPNEVWDAKISTRAKTVWIYLMSQGPRWNSSVSMIAKNLGIGRGTAEKVIQELVSHNMLSTKVTNRGTDFYLHGSDDWIVEWTGQTLLSRNAVVVHPGSKNLHPTSSTVAQPQRSIQYSNTNPTPNIMSDEDENFEDIETEETKSWNIHFLKSSRIEDYFKSLSLSDQAKLRRKFKSVNLKDDFVCEMNSMIYPVSKETHLLADISDDI
jgi:hypothetical protein